MLADGQRYLAVSGGLCAAQRAGRHDTRGPRFSANALLPLCRNADADAADGAEAIALISLKTMDMMACLLDLRHEHVDMVRRMSADLGGCRCGMLAMRRAMMEVTGLRLCLLLV